MGAVWESMKISRVTGFVFSVLLIDLLIYASFIEIEKHGLVPTRILSQYQNFTGLFLDMAIILGILFVLALVKDLILRTEWKQ